MRTDPSGPLWRKRILVAASGSIAAVKTPALVSALVKAGAQVRCLVTASAAELVSPVALASLSRHRCYQESDQWDASRSRPLHIELAEWAELLIVAPLSASSLARWSQGSADGLLASVLLAFEGTVLAVPAMNTAMWAHGCPEELVFGSRVSPRDSAAASHGVGCDRSGMAEWRIRH